MSRRALFFAVACALLCAPLSLLAQQQEPATFTMVAEWAIPRAQWTDYEASNKKNAQPVLERLLADGTIISWGMYTTMVHQEDRETHGVYYEANSVANVEKALGELLKLPPNPIIQAPGVKHHDFLLISPHRRSRAASGSGGYLWVSSSQVQPGKGQEWRDLWDKYNKPVYDDLVANGTISAYWLETEYVHTDNPSFRYVVYVTPNADGIDKVREAFAAAGQKRGPEGNRGIFQSFAEVTVAGAHRDYAARILAYGQK